MLDTQHAEMQPAGRGFPLRSNADVMIVLAQLLFRQNLFFAWVSKEWEMAWGGGAETHADHNRLHHCIAATDELRRVPHEETADILAHRRTLREACTGFPLERWRLGLGSMYGGSCTAA